VTATASYAAALDNAYGKRDPAAVIHAVKQVIINQLRQVDERVRVRTTDFFSHSFAPDLVLEWGHDDVVRRPLFVRQDVVDDYFVEDIAQLRSSAPIVFSLEATAYRRARAERAQAVTREANTLVTDAAGIGEIVEQKRNSRVVEIAAPSILQGGRGILDEDRVMTVSSGLTRGFMAANNLASDETREAIGLISSSFSPQYSSRFVEFLRAVWLGAGGQMSAFPAASHVSTGLTDEALRFLIDYESSADMLYWRRVGDGLTIDRLANMQLDASPNFDALIIANLDRIVGRSCHVQSSQERIPDESAGEWEARNGVLSWQGTSITVDVATRKNVLEQQSEYHGEIALDSLVERTRRHRIALESLEILAATRKISYGSTEQSVTPDISADEQLKTLASSLGSTASIAKAVAMLPGGRSLVCDYGSQIASGRTAAQFTLSEFLRFAVPLLEQLTDEDLHRLDQIIELNRTIANPPTLF
jgi:hypothetical protein